MGLGSAVRCFLKTRRVAFVRPGAVSCLVVVLSCIMALAQNDNEHAYSGPSPQLLCNTSSACGSVSTASIVDVKRANDGPAVMPRVSSAKGNRTFFAKTSTIVLRSTREDRGFVGDSGSSSLLGFHGATLGGAKRPASLGVRNAGWYSEGPCVSGVIPGMCGPGHRILLVWRHAPTIPDFQKRDGSADHNARKKFILARNLRRPSQRGNRP